MSFPRYPEYKDSGVEWLGEVPGHWMVTKTKHIIRFTTGWTPPTGESASYKAKTCGQTSLTWGQSIFWIQQSA